MSAMTTIALPRWMKHGALVLAAGVLFACASNPPPGEVVVVRRPPPNRVEVIAVSPGRNHVWVGGHWRWTGNDYDWVPGRWVAPERGYRRWVPGHWAHTKRGYYWVEGHWRR
jgi:hypothetical protein